MPQPIVGPLQPFGQVSVSDDPSHALIIGKWMPESNRASMGTVTALSNITGNETTWVQARVGTVEPTIMETSANANKSRAKTNRLVK